MKIAEVAKVSMLGKRGIADRDGKVPGFIGEAAPGVAA